MSVKKTSTAMAAVLAALITMTSTGCDGPSTTPSTAPVSSSKAPSAPAADYQLVTSGMLTICADAPFAPFVIENPSSPAHYSGFDVDLIQEVADRLGLRLTVVVVDFKSMVSGAAMVAGKCDFGATAITITEERKASIDFSDPYFESAQSLLAPADSGVASLADLAGKRIGVQSGTTGKDLAAAHAPKNAKLIDYASDTEMWQALQDGDIDAIVEDFPVTKMHEQDNPAFKVVATYPTDEEYGFAFAKGEKAELLKAMNEQLAEIRTDGTYFKIYGKYFG